MPPKIRELIEKLESAGFMNRGGRGSHRNYKHPAGVNITISGKLNSDARPYQEKDVNRALERVKK
ncbi:MAG: type II toxin-antitoxin system HicA family toxin [Thermodesulfobacteriota bacterium]|nr:type II toxin-antitoxin system HicA family toxin [Thermodesulfobacteriota bacterium]